MSKTKSLAAFYQRKNKTDGRMRICAECYQEIYWEGRRRAEELSLQREAKRQRERDEQKREEARLLEEKRLATEAWYLQQPARQCIACKQVLAASSFGYTALREVDDIWLPAQLHQRCHACHKEYRENNR
jgi:hypothetical protein